MFLNVGGKPIILVGSFKVLQYTFLVNNFIFNARKFKYYYYIMYYLRMVLDYGGEGDSKGSGDGAC